MDEREKRVHKVLTSLKGLAMTLSSKPLEVEAISTGSLLIDDVLGIGGFPRGRVVELFGSEGAGKSSLCFLTIADLQKKGGIAGYIDAENAIDGEYVRKLGVQEASFIFSQPDSGEQGLAVAEKMIEDGNIDLIVIDSVAALVPKKELEGEIGDPVIALQARLMSQALRRLSSKVGKSKVCLVFINQIRENVGVLWGSPEVTPGGRALKFYASVRLQVKRKTSVKNDKGVIVGDDVEVKVVKNKVAPPFRSCRVKMIWGKGYDESEGLVDLALQKGLVKNPKQGTYILSDGQEVRGREKVIQFYEDKPELVREMFEGKGE